MTKDEIWNRRITMLLTVAFLISLAYYFGVVDGRKEEYVCEIAEWECKCGDNFHYAFSLYNRTGGECYAMYIMYTGLDGWNTLNCKPVEKCRWERVNNG